MTFKNPIPYAHIHVYMYMYIIYKVFTYAIRVSSVKLCLDTVRENTIDISVVSCPSRSSVAFQGSPLIVLQWFISGLVRGRLNDQ